MSNLSLKGNLLKYEIEFKPDEQAYISFTNCNFISATVCDACRRTLDEVPFSTAQTDAVLDEKDAEIARLTENIDDLRDEVAELRAQLERT